MRIGRLNITSKWQNDPFDPLGGYWELRVTWFKKRLGDQT